MRGFVDTLKAAARHDSRFFFARSIFICALSKLEHIPRRYLFGPA
ncbi:hypothetical protein CHCC14814_3261 [Bacillus paralicheniformis]|nr:hypothetical protein CHCC14814_3261 [Bacillus paralicheniformis]